MALAILQKIAVSKDDVIIVVSQVISVKNALSQARGPALYAINLATSQHNARIGCVIIAALLLI